MTTIARGGASTRTPAASLPAGLLALLGALVALGPLATDAYVPGLPIIAAELRVAPAAVQLGVTACLVFLAVGQLAAGPWGDHVGRRIVILTGTAGFSAGAWIAAASWNGPSFIAALALQGFGGAFALVSANAVVRDRASGTAAAKAFSTLLLVTGLAPVLAPVLGTLLLATSSWRTIFVVTGSISALLALLVAFVIPRGTGPGAARDAGARPASAAWRVILGDRTFLGLAAGNALIFGAMFVYIAGGPFFLHDVYGLDEVQFGIVFAVNAAGLATAAHVGGRVVARLGTSRLVLSGAIVAVLGGLLLVTGNLIGGGVLGLVLLGFFLLVASVGLVLPFATATALEPHGQHAGTAMALFGATQYLLGAGGAALAGALTATGGIGLALAILALAVAGAAVLFIAAIPLLRHPAERPSHTSSGE